MSGHFESKGLKQGTVEAGRRADVLLIYPPASDASHPPLGVAALAGFLREHQQQVRILDLNLQSYKHFLSSEGIDATVRRLRKRLDDFATKGTLDKSDEAEYRIAAEALLAEPYIQRHIANALPRLRNIHTFSSVSRYSEASRVVKRTMEFVSAAYYPTCWLPRRFTMSYSTTRSSDIIAATSDRKQNLFLGFFKQVLPEIVAQRPAVIGLSINHSFQLIPGMTLLRLLRRELPDSFLTVGGGIISFFADDQYQRLGSFAPFVDAFVPFEGEYPLLEILKALADGRNPQGLPGIISFPSGKPQYRPEQPPDIQQLPPPDFSELDLDNYLAPKRILPLLSSRGCYWGRCAFCTQGHLYRGRYRARSPEQVVADIKLLNHKFGGSSFYIVDECVPPKTALKIAGYVQSSAKPLTWFGEMRFERTLNRSSVAKLYRGGCRMLMFGLESANERVLGFMEKGTSPTNTAAVLEACRSAGVHTYLMSFSGFPTETLSEAEDTLKFLVRMRHCISQASHGFFRLARHSPVHKHPSKYRVAQISPHADDIDNFADYEVAEGLSSEDVFSFLDDVHKRPEIKALGQPMLLARAHLPFLPFAEVVASEDLQIGDREQQRLPGTAKATSYPRLAPEVRVASLPFSLGNPRYAGEDDEDATSRQKESWYLYDGEQDRLFEIDTEVRRLLDRCDGSIPLSEILKEVDKPEALAKFLTNLEKLGMLQWLEHTEGRRDGTYEQEL